MKLSTDRILTTHVGSLPRSGTVVELLYKKDGGEPFDEKTLAEVYVDAVAAAMKPEYDAIVAAGFVLQLDCLDLAMARNFGFQELSEAEFLARAEQQVEALNHAVRDIPADRMRMRICWGNCEGPRDHDVPLETILPIVRKAKPAGILFEAANSRHRHEWEVCQYADIVGRERVIAGADCGFGSFAGYSRVDPAIAYKKLRALADGAALASDTLWRRNR